MNISKTIEKIPDPIKPLFPLMLLVVYFLLSIGAISSTQKQVYEFIKSIKYEAIKNYDDTCVLASITIAKACLESAYGKSNLASKTNNLFGIKCLKKDCTIEGHCIPFVEDYPKDRFRKYASREEGIKDHSKLMESQRYCHLLEKRDYRKWATGLKEAGYAEDPEYSRKLIWIIKKYGLHELDG